MPNCNKYFDELAQCLVASSCVQKQGMKPSECLQSLLKGKVFEAKRLNHRLSEDVNELKKEEFAPMECSLKHQSYVECKVSLVKCGK